MYKVKKKIRPFSILRFVWWTIWIFFIALSIGAIIAVFVERKFVYYNILATILGFIMLTISLFFFFADFKKGVKFDAEGIKILADVADKKGLIVKKLQHKLNVNYADIKDISIDFSKNDTHNKQVAYVFVDMPNIVLTLKDDNQERINVYYYNRKQRVEIVDRIRLAVEESGQKLDVKSGKDLWSEAYSKVK